MSKTKKTTYPALPAEIDHCGYFRGETMPAGCKLYSERTRAAIRVATQAQNLCNFMRTSLDVGPSQFTSPRQEAWHWRALHDALAEFTKLASVAAQAKE